MLMAVCLIGCGGFVEAEPDAGAQEDAGVYDAALECDRYNVAVCAWACGTNLEDPTTGGGHADGTTCDQVQRPGVIGDTLCSACQTSGDRPLDCPGDEHEPPHPCLPWQVLHVEAYRDCRIELDHAAPTCAPWPDVCSSICTSP